MTPATQDTTAELRSADLQVQQLHTFRAVYTLGGYSAAASQSKLSVPTIWQHIQSLEKNYGVSLFEKAGRGIRPTRAARRLYEAVDEILVSLESTYDIVRNEEPTGRLTLVTGVRQLMEDLGEPLCEFRKRYPNPLLIRHGDNARGEELILSGEAQLAFSLEPAAQIRSPSIHYEPCYFADFLAIAPARHPFTLAGTSSLRELVKHPLIVTAEGTHGREALEQALHRERLSAHIAVETDNSAFTISCVRSGMGVGILAGQMDGPLSKRLVARSLRRQLGRRQIVVMWRKGRRLSEAETGLIELIHKHHAAKSSRG